MPRTSNGFVPYWPDFWPDFCLKVSLHLEQQEWTGNTKRELERMHRGFGRPFSKPFPIEIKHSSAEKPHDKETHIQHDGFDETSLLRPYWHESADPIAPEILVDRDGHKNGSGNGLVAIDGI